MVETTEDVELLPDFCWLTLAQIQELVRMDNVVNMDARTVLSIMRFAPPPEAAAQETTARETAAHETPGLETGFLPSLRRSLSPEAPTVHSTTDALSWLTESKARYELDQRRVPLREVAGWRCDEKLISRDDGGHFSVVGVAVRAQNREVAAWTQPLLMPAGSGLAAFFVRRFDGVLHVLAQARPTAGALDIVEVAPTVQCNPQRYLSMPPERRPAYLEQILAAPASDVRYDALQSEEGGRFLDAHNRYLIVEVGADFPTEEPEGFRWLSVHQLASLIEFGAGVNVEARSLLTCLHTLW
ncbi:NDP-hexose 2,3-dehydratase family protein [Streptomyces sp. 150FB]|uniref:NDP-hexose 2,3-dehydratase family protein n=1 Tax=Streptomyces sp. 150FB TaxID=1576605 RepID=UPI0026BDF99A